MARSSDYGTERVNYALIAVALVAFTAIVAVGIADGFNFGVLLGIGGTLLGAVGAAFDLQRKKREKAKRAEDTSEARAQDAA